jgi:single-stranded-DNA-specific exonuclease
MEKNWKLKDKAKQLEIEQMSQALNINETLANLLLQRGINTFKGAKSFFRPQLTDLHDPFLMKDMKKAVERVNLAIEREEKILIYGDYDVDGTTSVALVYAFLKDRYPHLDYYIPDRYSQGYGISYQGVEYAAQNGFTLVISLDCGIKAVEKIGYAKKKGIEFIICDHHTPGDEIPDASAVLDPKQSDCDYPFKHLSGCGVGFKMLQGFAQYNKIPFYELEPYLDLVCVSIASDIVPIVGENRVLSHFGLLQLNNDPRAGLRSTIIVSNLQNKDITISDIVFKIGPRINAAGRMESGRKSVDLLIAENDERAASVMSEVNAFNEERKDLDRNITLQALDMVLNNEIEKDKKTTVLYKNEWHKGVIGIVASRLIETHYRPTVILTESNGFATGSARTVEGYDIYQAIEQCSDLLENFGGHTYAAGLTMKIEHVPEFKRRFEEFVAKTINKEQLVPQVEIDTMMDLKEITPKFYKILKQFAPFGPENMSPVFMTRNVTDYGSGKVVGKNSEHLKLDLMQNDDTSMVFPAIAFNKAAFYDIVRQRIPFHIVYTVIENEFRGRTSLQLMIKEIKVEI